MWHSTRFAAILMIGALAACARDAAAPTAPTGTIAFAAQAGGDTPVTATVTDADAAIAPTLQIRSDALGAYVNSRTLTSVLQGGDWVLDSFNPRNATRRVFLEFSQPIAGSGPGGGAPVAVPSALYRARFISKCNTQLGTSFLTLVPGASMPCPLHIRFAYGGSEYTVQMNPTGPNEPAPETNYATVTCVTPSSGSGPCTGWTITPSGAGGQNVVKLFKYVTTKNSSTAVSQGNFYFSFRIGVTNP